MVLQRYDRPPLLWLLRRLYDQDRLVLPPQEFIAGEPLDFNVVTFSEV